MWSKLKGLLSLLLFNSIISFAQKDKLEFGIYFGNDFHNDSVTIYINDVHIVKNIKLKRTMIAPQSLVITQQDKNLFIAPYYESKQTKNKILIQDSIINLRIALNNNWQNFRFNLSEGKFLYPEECFFRVGWYRFRILKIFQSKHKPQYM